MHRVCRIVLISLIISFLSLLTFAGTPGGLPPERALHPGEWEDMRAQLLSWPIGSPGLDDFFCELVDNIQEHCEVWMVLRDTTEKDYVVSTLNSHGVPLTNVVFLYEQRDAIWSRDYGPLYLRTPTGEARITDPKYYLLRPYDDVIPYRIGMREEIPVHEAHFYYEGGNFQSDGHGHCFFTDGVYEDNPSLTQEQIHQIFYDYLGCVEVTALQKMTGGVIKHIDMFAKLLSPTKWLVGQYPEGDQNYQILEDNAALLASLTAHNGEPYEVVRIPMPPTTLTTLTIDYGDLLPRYDETKIDSSIAQAETWRTHTNSVIANQIVLVPTYDHGTDAEALQIYQDAMPGYTIVGINSEAIIPNQGAIHCVIMEIPEYPSYEGLAFDSIQNLSERDGNGNSYIDPGETWEFQVVLENHGGETTGSTSARVELHSSISSGAAMLKSFSEYGDIPGGSTASSSSYYTFALDVSYPCGQALVFNLVDITSSKGTDADEFQFLRLNVGDETVVTRFWDDMEFGVGGWTHSSIGGATDLWHQQTDPGCFPAESPTTQWVFVEDSDCDYATGDRVAANLTSQTIPGITSNSRLFFDYWREVDRSYEHPIFASDFFRVEVSDDGFTTSETLLDLSSMNPSHAQWLADGPYDLSSYVGGSVQVRFVFDSETSAGNLWRGVGIDDVLVEDRTYSCSSFSPHLPAEVPDGLNTPGDLLTMQKDGTDLIISWDIGCNASYSTDYAIYRGTISALTSDSWDHVQITCTDAGADLTETIAGDVDSYYFLVVPHNGVVEGNCGEGTTGPRPNSSSPCYAAGEGSCL